MFFKNNQPPTASKSLAMSDEIEAELKSMVSNHEKTPDASSMSREDQIAYIKNFLEKQPHPTRDTAAEMEEQAKAFRAICAKNKPSLVSKLFSRVASLKESITGQFGPQR